MSNEGRYPVFRTTKVSPMNPVSIYSGERRHYDYSRHISERDDDDDDDYELKSMSPTSTRSSILSQLSDRSESPQLQIVRVSSPKNSSSQLRKNRHDDSFLSTKSQPRLVSTSPFTSYIASRSYPILKKTAWIPSRKIILKDAVTQKSASIQTKLITMTPSAVGWGTLLLILGLAIITIIVLSLLLSSKLFQSPTSSSDYSQMSCGSTCVMTGTPYHTSTTALWRFDGDPDDMNHIYYGTFTPTSGTPTYQDGNIAKTLLFDGTHYVLVNTQFMNLSYQSWTIEGWFWFDTAATEHGIFSQCASSTTDGQCLSLSLKNGRMYSSFRNDDLTGSTILSLPSSTTWHHLAFVYDYTFRKQSVYIDGVLDGTTWGTRVLSGPYKGMSGDILIGRLSSGSYFDGKIDHLQVSNGAKSACEILFDAILTAYYSFDNGVLNLDLSNNYINGVSNLITTVSGLINEAYLFNQTLSYFQSFAFTAYTYGESFSVSLWIKPYSIVGGTIIHLSTNIGGGGTACFDLLGFSSAGQLIANLYYKYDCCMTTCFCYHSTNINTTSTITTNIWTHIVLTYSSTSGMALYLNGTLNSASNAAFYTFPTTGGAFVTRPYMTVGNYLTTSTAVTCQTNSAALSPGSYQGLIDELRVYSRELSAAEICSLFNY